MIMHQQRENISAQRNDVLFDEGRNVLSHKGNRLYWSLIKKYRNAFLNSKKNYEKGKIAQQILDDIKGLTPPGRFLVKTEDDEWREQIDALTLAKMKQSLRRNGKIVPGDSHESVANIRRRHQPVQGVDLPIHIDHRTKTKDSYCSDETLQCQGNEIVTLPLFFSRNKTKDSYSSDETLQCQGNDIVTLPQFNPSRMNYGLSPLVSKNSHPKCNYGQKRSSDMTFYF